MGSKADIVILMLGTNDAKTVNWNKTAYVEDYLEMANNFLNLPSKPNLHLMISPPLYKEMQYGINHTVVNEILPNLIPIIARTLSL